MVPVSDKQGQFFIVMMRGSAAGECNDTVGPPCTEVARVCVVEMSPFSIKQQCYKNIPHIDKHQQEYEGNYLNAVNVC